MQGSRVRAAPGTCDLRWQRCWHGEAAPLIIWYVRFLVGADAPTRHASTCRMRMHT